MLLTCQTNVIKCDSVSPCTDSDSIFIHTVRIGAFVVMALLRGMKVAMVRVSSKSKTTSFTGGWFLEKSESESVGVSGITVAFTGWGSVQENSLAKSKQVWKSGLSQGTESLRNHVPDISRASSPCTSMGLQRNASRCRSQHHDVPLCRPYSSPFACHSTSRHHIEQLCSIAAHWPQKSNHDLMITFH